MTTQAHRSAKPTNRQLTYIRDLNARTGTDFTDPVTAGQARQQIDRLTVLVTEQNLAIERFIRLVEDFGLTPFDAAFREGAAVRFVWNDRKVIVVIDLEDDDPTDPAGTAAIGDDTALAA